MTPEVINPAQIIKETVEGAQPQAKEKGLHLYCEVPKAQFFIKVNANRLRQILINLITNGIKYSREGEIKVAAQADEARGKYVIYITDTGLGIAAQEQGKLFQKFSRIKSADTAEIPGTGLGLWISREIARKMGGDIFLASMENVGSSFTIVFQLERS
jgi:signal transduction histidine kinase